MATIKLYEINQNGNKFCGPSALSALAGIGTKDTAALLRKVSGRTKIFGTHDRDVLEVLRLLGFRHETKLSVPKKFAKQQGTMRNWLKANAKAGETFLIVAGWHWIVAQGKTQVICGLTKKMVHIDDHPKNRSFVAAVYKLTKVEEVDVEKVVAANLPPKQAMSRTTEGKQAHAARRKALALIKQYGFIHDEFHEDDVISGTVMIYPPSTLFEDDDENDPHQGDHVNYGWVDALAMVNEYVELINRK